VTQHTTQHILIYKSETKLYLTWNQELNKAAKAAEAFFLYRGKAIWIG